MLRLLAARLGKDRVLMSRTWACVMSLMGLSCVRESYEFSESYESYMSSTIAYESYEFYVSRTYVNRISYEFLFHTCDGCVWRTLEGPLWLRHAHACSYAYAARRSNREFE